MPTLKFLLNLVKGNSHWVIVCKCGPPFQITKYITRNAKFSLPFFLSLTFHPPSHNQRSRWLHWSWEGGWACATLKRPLSRHVSVLQTSGWRGQGLTSSAGQSERSRLLLKASCAAGIKPPRRADAILEDTERSISDGKPDKESCSRRPEKHVFWPNLWFLF